MADYFFIRGILIVPSGCESVLRLKVAKTILTHPWSMFSVVVRIVRIVVPVVNCTLKELALFQTLEVRIEGNDRLCLVHDILATFAPLWRGFL